MGGAQQGAHLLQLAHRDPVGVLRQVAHPFGQLQGRPGGPAHTDQGETLADGPLHHPPGGLADGLFHALHRLLVGQNLFHPVPVELQRAHGTADRRDQLTMGKADHLRAGPADVHKQSL